MILKIFRFLKRFFKKVPYYERLLTFIKQRLPMVVVSFLYRNTSINRDEILSFIETFNQSGITLVKRNPKLIVSLTSYPARISELHFTLYSLFNQSLKPDEIVLWLGEKQFPNREQNLPKNVLRFKEFGLTIKFCKDIRSFTKLIPSLIHYPDDIIITSDDDMYYRSNWLEQLYRTYQQEPQIIHCQWAWRILITNKNEIQPFSIRTEQTCSNISSFNNMLLGVAGVIYPPRSLHPDIFCEDMFLKICPLADDIWFWAMAVLNGTKIKQISRTRNLPLFVDLKKEILRTGEQLGDINVVQNFNDVQLKMVLYHYPLIMEKLLLEKKQLISDNRSITPKIG
jgi:hypothetical protein